MSAVYIDVDTQFDFVSPSGALYAPGAERIIENVSRLNRWAAAHSIPVISTTDAHAENDPEFADWPPHCVAGTLGQRKPEASLLDGRIVVPNADGAVAAAGARQIILEKQTVNVFQTRTIHAVLEALHADRYVVYGVVTEICVLYAVLGLLKTGRPVAVVTDAIQHLREPASAKALAEITAAGGSLTTTAATCA